MTPVASVLLDVLSFYPSDLVGLVVEYLPRMLDSPCNVSETLVRDQEHNSSGRLTVDAANGNVYEVLGSHLYPIRGVEVAGKVVFESVGTDRCIFFNLEPPSWIFGINNGRAFAWCREGNDDEVIVQLLNENATTQVVRCRVGRENFIQACRVDTEGRIHLLDYDESIYMYSRQGYLLSVRSARPPPVDQTIFTTRKSYSAVLWLIDEHNCDILVVTNGISWSVLRRSIRSITPASTLWADVQPDWQATYDKGISGAALDVRNGLLYIFFHGGGYQTLATSSGQVMASNLSFFPVSMLYRSVFIMNCERICPRTRAKTAQPFLVSRVENNISIFS